MSKPQYAFVLLACLLLLSACQTSATASEFTLITGELRDNSEIAGFAFSGDEITSPGPTIRVKKGDEITITLNNQHGYAFSENISHNFEILPEKKTTGDTLWGAIIGERFSPIPAGESGSVTFTPARPGEFFYICTVPGHLTRGMYGSFIVEE